MVRGMEWKVPLILALIVLAVVSAWPLQKKIPLGMDLAGGVELRYMLDVSAVPASQLSGIEEQAISVISKRLDPDGVMALDIRPLAEREILIRLPGLDPARVDTIRRGAETISPLEFRLISNEQWEPQKFAEAQQRPKDDPPEGYRWMEVKEDNGQTRQHLVKIKDDYNVTGKYLSRAGMGSDEKQLPGISFELSPEGGVLFGRLTGENIGRPMGIILAGRLVSVATIKDKIVRNGIISRPGGFSRKEIDDQVAFLRSGSLPVRLIFEGQDFVGPSLGQDSIHKGIQAVIVGLVLVLIFMACYYLAAGLVANVALFLNLLFLVGAMASFHAVLTLPGIAGVVLALGMAVDANVLIFERIREERAAGKVLRFAVKNGYERAWSAIIDSNLTTLITTLILFYTGTGPVRGFAVTLALGIVLSMFTQLFVTRVIFDLLIARGWVKDLRMVRLVPPTRIGFVRLFPAMMLMSWLLIIGGMSFFLYRGERNLGIDLTSGSQVHLQLAKEMDIGVIRKMVTEAGYGEAEVQSSLGDDIGARYRSTSREFKIRTRASNPQQVEADMRRLFLPFAPEEPVAVTNHTFQEVPANPQAGTPRNLGVLLDVAAPLGEEQIRAGLTRAGFPEARVEVPPEEAGSETHQRFTVWLGDVASQEALSKLQGAFVAPVPFKAVRFIGTSEARETVIKAVYAVVLAWVGIIIYVWARFGKFRHGFAGVVALIHDVFITLGAIAVADALGGTAIGRFLRLGDIKIDMDVIAALLTMIGYSINDTIVVFDRIRERVSHRRELSAPVVDEAINQTLSRTVLTSLTVLLVTVVLYFLGGARIHGFAFTMTIGVITGTYSSIFIASPLLIWEEVWERVVHRRLATAE
jgi:SecD/SecF fusion protein